MRQKDRDPSVHKRAGMEIGERLSKIEEDITLLVAAVNLIEGHQDEVSSADTQWKCKGCGNRLAFFDPIENIIRVKMRDQYVSMKSGVGGWVEIICRKCGLPNKVSDT